MRCHYCKKTSARMTRDHVVPLSKGGVNMPFNIVPACGPCNARKGEDWPRCMCGWCRETMRIHHLIYQEVRRRNAWLGRRWAKVMTEGKHRARWTPSERDLTILAEATTLVIAEVPERWRPRPRHRAS